jgi:YVTN family beta-propeller protein
VINQNSKIAYVTLWNGELDAINLNTGAVTPIPGASALGKAAVDPNTGMVYVIDYSGNNIDVVDGATNTLVATIPTPDMASAIALNPVTGKAYFTMGDSGSVGVIDEATNTIQSTINGIYEYPAMIAVNPDTNAVYVVSHDPSGISMSSQSVLTTIDGSSNQITRRQNFPGSTFDEGDIAVNQKDGTLSIAQGRSGATYLFSGDGKLKNSVNLSSDSVQSGTYGAAVNQETGNTYQATYDKGLKVYNRNGTEIETIPAVCATAVDVTNL